MVNIVKDPGFWTQKNIKRKLGFGKMDIFKMSKTGLGILFFVTKKCPKKSETGM